jgi:hypothetical protein
VRPSSSRTEDRPAHAVGCDHIACRVCTIAGFCR